MSDEAVSRPGRRFRLGTWDPERHYLDDLYWARVLRSVHDRAREVGVELVDLPSPADPSDDAVNDDVLLRLRSAGVDVVLDWPHAETRATTVLDSGIPIVHLSETSLDHPLLIAPEGLEGVAFDLVTRAARAIGGSGTILAVGGGMQLAYSDDGASRLRGSKRAVTSLPDVDLIHVPTFWDARAADQVARALREDARPIDAIVGFSDRVASLARKCCLEAGRAHADVPTFGINGTPDAIAEILSGTMTGTAEGLANDLGRRAVDVAVAVAGRTRYPRHFPYRFRYVDASLASAVAARMLVDLGSAIRTPRTSIVREGSAMDHVAMLMADADQAFLASPTMLEAWALTLDSIRRAFDVSRVVAAWPEPTVRNGSWLSVTSDEPALRSAVPDFRWVEVARSMAPMVGVSRDASASTLVPLGTDFGPHGCLDLVHDSERIFTLTEMDALRDVSRHVASLGALRGRGGSFEAFAEHAASARAVRTVVWLESAADGRAVVEDLRVALGESAVGVRVLPSSRRAKWRWDGIGAAAATVDVAVLARWTPETADWISRWRAERRRGQVLLVLSGLPWPVEALAAMPRDVHAVLHSTVTLPSQEVAAWVSARLRDSSAGPGEQALARVRATVARLHASFDEPLRRDDLARDAALDADRLTRTFREVMGIAPRTYLARLRVHHAMRLLRTTDLTVTEIGARVGWHDPAHFSTAFRRTTGRSPKAFRREERGERR